MVLDIEQETGMARETSFMMILALALVEARMVPVRRVVRRREETMVVWVFICYVLL